MPPTASAQPAEVEDEEEEEESEEEEEEETQRRNSVGEKKKKDEEVNPDSSEGEANKTSRTSAAQKAAAGGHHEVKAQEMSRVPSNAKKEEKIDGRAGTQEQKYMGSPRNSGKDEIKQKKLDEVRRDEALGDAKKKKEGVETKETVVDNWPKPSPWAFSSPILRNPVGRQRAPGKAPKVQPEEEEEALLESFGCFTGGGARLKASGAASFLRSVFHMSGLDERALAEVIQEQVAAGTDSLTKAQFIEFVGSYLDDRDPHEEFVELWKDMGGATAGDGYVRSSEVHRVLDASGLFHGAPPEMLRDFCMDKEFLNYDDFVRMIAEPRVPHTPSGWQAGRAVLESTAVPSP